MARQNFLGIVVSQGKMMKTIKVRVQQPRFNQVINKELLRTKDYMVHDEGDVCREGDMVRIEATRPLSRHKSFAVAEILKNKGQQHVKYSKEAKFIVAEEENQKTKDFLNRRETHKNNSSGLVSDFLFLDKISSTPESLVNEDDLKKANDLKIKYGVNSWPPKTPLVTETSNLKLKLDKIQNQITKEESKAELISAKIDEILSDESLIKSTFKKLGRDPQGLKDNIRKNLIRKYVIKDLQL